MENEELKETEVKYELWVVGDKADNTATDFDFMITDIAKTQNELLALFNYFNNKDRIEAWIKDHKINLPKEVKHIRLLAEEVVDEDTELVDEASIW